MIALAANVLIVARDERAGNAIVKEIVQHAPPPKSAPRPNHYPS